MEWVGDGLILLGAGVLFVSAFGLFVLRNALSRQHAAANAGSFGLAFVVAGVALAAGDWSWTWRAMVIVAAVWVTLPVASHVLARAALREHLKTKPIQDVPLYKWDESGKSKPS